MSITLNDRIKDTLQKTEPSPIGVFTIMDSYASVYRGNPRRTLTELQLTQLKKNWGKVDYSGKISANTSKNIRVMLTGWSRALETYNRLHCIAGTSKARQIVFITLTLPSEQKHDDNYIKRHLLTRFLSELKKFSNTEHYFWKAESQKNGNIHFHILSDSYVHKSLVNWLWDRVLSCHGYMECDVEYNTNYGSTTTKIEAPRMTDSVAIYVVKYCLKDDGYRQIDGRIWGCSDSLRDIDRFCYDLTIELFEKLQKAIKKSTLSVISSTYCDVYIGNVYGLLCSIDEQFKYEADCYYYDVYNYLY